MISLLRGRIAYKSLRKVIIDVGGVGYGVTVPLSTYYLLPELGSETELKIQTNVKESSIELFGFLNDDEREVFSLLIGVSGVGPKLAVSILSNVAPGDLARAVCSGDLEGRKIPGIGSRLASRLVTELKGKFSRFEPDAKAESEAGIIEDVISALMNLGYKRPEIDVHISQIETITSKEKDIEVALRESLRLMKKA